MALRPAMVVSRNIRWKKARELARERGREREREREREKEKSKAQKLETVRDMNYSQRLLSRTVRGVFPTPTHNALSIINCFTGT